MKSFVAILSVLLVFTLNGTLPAAEAPTQPEASIEKYVQSLGKIAYLNMNTTYELLLRNMPGASDLVDIMKFRVEVHANNPQYRKVILLSTYFDELPQTSAWQKISEQQKMLFEYEKNSNLATRLEDYIFEDKSIVKSNKVGLVKHFYAYSPEDAYYVVVGIGEIVEKYRLNKIKELTELIEQDQKFIADCEQKCAEAVKEMQNQEPLVQSLKDYYSDVARAKEDYLKWKNQLEQICVDIDAAKATLQAVTRAVNDLRGKIGKIESERAALNTQAKNNNDPEIAQKIETLISQQERLATRLDSLEQSQTDIIIDQAGQEVREKAIRSKAGQIRLLLMASEKYQEASAIHSASLSNIDSAKARIDKNRKSIDNLIPLLSDDIVKLASNISVIISQIYFK